MHQSAMTEPGLHGAFVLTWTWDHPDFPDAMAVLSPQHMYYFDFRGITRVFDLRIDHAGWSPPRLDTTFSHRYTARFEGLDAMATEGKYARDRGSTWLHDFTMSSTRVDQPRRLGWPMTADRARTR